MAGKGGIRSTSFQPKWRLGETVAIRVPVAVKEYLLRIARLLDNGEDYERQIILTAIDRYIELERNRDRNGNQYGKEFKTDSPRWQKVTYS